ncbi:MAG: hypothetical protein MRZ97_00965 [Firmicutes bacterium]|nr:hypothetical protein [Bacillota bacterium]
MLQKRVKGLSTLLIIALVFSCTTAGAFASESVQIQDLPTNVQGKVSESCQEKLPQIMEELEVLKSHGMDPEYLTCVDYGSTLTYEFQLPSVQNVTQISLQQYDGGVVIEYREGTKHDIVDYRDNGDIYLDGKLVEVTIDETTSLNTEITPRAGTRTEYSDSSYVSGGSYIEDDNGEVYSINPQKPLIKMTVSALANLILTVLPNGIGLVITALSTADFFSHATSIQALARRAAPDGYYFSFKWMKLHHSSNDAFIKYYRYWFRYYVRQYCTGESTSANLYQRTLVY